MEKVWSAILKNIKSQDPLSKIAFLLGVTALLVAVLKA